MVRTVLVCLLFSVSFAQAAERLVIESNGCVIEAKNAEGFSFEKSDEEVSFIKYRYEDGRSENIRVRCKAITLEQAIANGYVKEKDGLKIDTGSLPLARAELISGGNWSGVEATYFLNSVCFTTVFEAGKTHVISIEACGEQADMKALRKSFLRMLQHSDTAFVIPMNHPA